jgi:hypothetical protein
MPLFIPPPNPPADEPPKLDEPPKPPPVDPNELDDDPKPLEVELEFVLVPPNPADDVEPNAVELFDAEVSKPFDVPPNPLLVVVGIVVVVVVVVGAGAGVGVVVPNALPCGNEVIVGSFANAS